MTHRKGHYLKRNKTIEIRQKTISPGYLVIQHDFSRVCHDALGIARLFPVDKDDAAQPANESYCAGVDQLLLGDGGAAVW